MGFFIALIWIIYTGMLLYNFRELMEEMSIVSQVLLELILFIGAPFFLGVEILEFLLDLILPEGWDDD